MLHLGITNPQSKVNRDYSKTKNRLNKNVVVEEIKNPSIQKKIETEKKSPVVPVEEKKVLPSVENKCNFCGTILKTKKGLSAHIKKAKKCALARGEKPMRHKCPYCEMGFNNRSLLDVHVASNRKCIKLRGVQDQSESEEEVEEEEVKEEVLSEVEEENEVETEEAEEES